MPKSEKTTIIEALFDKRWKGPGKPLSGPIVTLDHVQKALTDHNRANPSHRLSTRNPANFFKDFIRKRRSANANWPPSVLKRGFTARQVTGKGQCFEFVLLPPGQKEPFPAGAIHPRKKTPTHDMQSASMPIASRRMGRRDEAWLIQVISRLHIIETHLALHGPATFLQVDLLQTNVKLARAEIDAVFLALEEPVLTGQPPREAIITCEAKGLADDIIPDQVLAQVKAAFTMEGLTQDKIVPLAAKAVAPSTIHVVQFSSVSRKEAPLLSALSVQSDALYRLVPPVPGIGR